MNIDFVYIGIEEIQKFNNSQLQNFWDNIPDWYEEIRNRNWEENNSEYYHSCWEHLKQLENTARGEMLTRNLNFSQIK